MVKIILLTWPVKLVQYIYQYKVDTGDINIDKELLHTKVVREIISYITAGEYNDSQRLPSERKFCERFGVSRGTLRRGLLDLEIMGTIKIKPGSGVYVQKINQKKLRRSILPPGFADITLGDTIIARRAIEMAAAELACEKVTNKQLTKMDKLILSMEKAIDNLPEYIRYDMLFHELVVRASGNPALIAAFEAIWEYHKYSQVFSSSNDECEETALVYHKKLIAALKNGNKTLALKALKNHFDYMIKSKRK